MSVENKRVIYPNGTGISVLVPSPKWSGTIEQLANKDVPTGVPYIITDLVNIPTDREFRDSWEVDFSNPDGYGGLND